MSQNKKNKLNSDNNSRLNVANIVQRLPFHRQLNVSQMQLIKLIPAWQSWAADTLLTEQIESIKLSSVQNGELTMICSNSIIASQLKHLQNSLLEALNKTQSSTTIRLIKIRLSHESISNHELETTKLANQNNETNNQSDRQKPNSESIKSIEQCQKQISNESLANSLTRLADTLKKV